jgi:hypothetical protein
MIPKKPAPDLIRDGSWFSAKITLERNLDHDPVQLDRIVV